MTTNDTCAPHQIIHHQVKPPKRTQQPDCHTLVTVHPRRPTLIAYLSLKTCAAPPPYRAPGATAQAGAWVWVPFPVVLGPCSTHEAAEAGVARELNRRPNHRQQAHACRPTHTKPDPRGCGLSPQWYCAAGDLVGAAVGSSASRSCGGWARQAAHPHHALR